MLKTSFLLNKIYTGLEFNKMKHFTIKYFMVLNENDQNNINNQIYKTGLNKMTCSFEPNKEPNIHFCSTDPTSICTMLHHGKYIREVIIPSDARVVMLTSYPYGWITNRVYLNERMLIKDFFTKYLLGLKLSQRNQTIRTMASWDDHSYYLQFVDKQFADKQFLI